MNAKETPAFGAGAPVGWDRRARREGRFGAFSGPTPPPERSRP